MLWTSVLHRYHFPYFHYSGGLEKRNEQQYYYDLQNLPLLASRAEKTTTATIASFILSYLAGFIIDGCIFGLGYSQVVSLIVDELKGQMFNLGLEVDGLLSWGDSAFCRRMWSLSAWSCAQDCDFQSRCFARGDFSSPDGVMSCCLLSR